MERMSWKTHAIEEIRTPQEGWNPFTEKMQKLQDKVTVTPRITTREQAEWVKENYMAITNEFVKLATASDPDHMNWMPTKEEAQIFQLAEKVIWTWDEYEAGRLSEKEKDHFIRQAPDAWRNTTKRDWMRFMSYHLGEIRKTNARHERARKLEAQGKSLCTKCGGQGGADCWPGFTCYRCNGTGIEPARPSR